MKVTLKLRQLSAYFVEKSVTLADDETLEIQIADKGRLSGRVVLLCNGKSFFADDNKVVHIDRQTLTTVNVFELQARDTDGKVLQRWVTESLYTAPMSTDYANDRLVTEREFYAELCTRQSAVIETLQEQVTDLTNRVAALESGKFKILNFGGNEE
nr:MAG TPA: hypothetical protein [Caudoviricetes sp.]